MVTQSQMYNARFLISSTIEVRIVQTRDDEIVCFGKIMSVRMQVPQHHMKPICVCWCERLKLVYGNNR